MHSYKFDAVLEVTGGPSRSPYDPEFDPHSIPGIESIGDDIRTQLARRDEDPIRGRFVLSEVTSQQVDFVLQIGAAALQVNDSAFFPNGSVSWLVGSVLRVSGAVWGVGGAAFPVSGAK